MTTFLPKPSYRVACTTCGDEQLGFVDGKSLFCVRCYAVTVHKKVDPRHGVVDYEEAIRAMHETDR